MRYLSIYTDYLCRWAAAVAGASLYIIIYLSIIPTMRNLSIYTYILSLWMGGGGGGGCTSHHLCACRPTPTRTGANTRAEFDEDIDLFNWALTANEMAILDQRACKLDPDLCVSSSGH
eukprot:COSAG01_NODE_1289_length_10885_cov_3.769331_5_plen_118_part_00